MTERWVSSKKKFCEICRCWFADNPAALRHHESGTRHMAGVQAKIHSIGAKSRAKEAEDRETSKILAAMTAGALSSYRSDAKGSSAAARAYNIEANMPTVRPVGRNRGPPEPEPEEPTGPKPPAGFEGILFPGMPGYRFPGQPPPRPVGVGTGGNMTPLGKTSRMPAPPAPSSAAPRVQYKEGPLPGKPTDGRLLWAEARSPEGIPYYFHLESGQTAWEAPKTGFLSLVAQEREAAKAAKAEQDAEFPSIAEQIRRAALEVEEATAAEVRKEEAVPSKISFAFTTGAAALVGPAKPAPSTVPLRVADLDVSSSDSEEEDPAPRPRKERKPRPISKKEQAAKELVAAIEAREAAEKEKEEPPQVTYAAGMPGQWTSVPTASEYEEEENPLGLPTLPEVEWREFAATEEDAPLSRLRFGEKTVQRIQEAKGKERKNAAPVAFKKRKLGGAARNSRKRDDDE